MLIGNEGLETCYGFIHGVELHMRNSMMCLCFETTYLVNRYQMPFATFVGVNHHGQSIMLGCALLSHEDVETFRWVFSTWLLAMVDIHPYAILTDQCESIKAAIKEVMPETRHRFCLWHIVSKVSEKFKGVEDFTKATNKFKTLIVDSLTIEMFETNWNDFLTKSKGMNAYFDGYVNSRSTQKQFVKQYEIAIRGKNEKELLSEFISKNKVVNCISQFGWERQFQHAFTHEVQVGSRVD
ncbi:hypothetical protein GH714_020232 [Hevea brasiliensis]|uniref:Protein FAR1-RELATED SEQUENCE n=1 Tax=Hevea brasiliensis TaxID=3981 RepID=A0A6A6L577_HEVBR|nr:hypothetical protein GH714_020232 [Hevea brasiliensis]